MPLFSNTAIAYAIDASVEMYPVIHEPTSAEASQPSNFGQVPGIQMMADLLCILSVACCTAPGAAAWWVRRSDLRTMNEVVHTKWQKVL